MFVFWWKPAHAFGIADVLLFFIAEENIYIGIYPMPDSSPFESRRIARALIRKYNPYFNRGV